jgi:ATP-binding cassette subfamily C exporter for protease/lipase
LNCCFHYNERFYKIDIRQMFQIPAFCKRSVLSRFLFSFRREFLYAFWFTALINVLMLAPTLYMLQIFDRVLVGYNEFTLYAVTLMLLFFLGVMSFSEWVRARLLVRLGARMDCALNVEVFSAAFAMQNRGENGAQLFANLTCLRQFLTGTGLFAFLDAPWTPLYILALFVLHPALGILAIIFCLLLYGVAYLSNQVMTEPLQEASASAQKEARYLAGKLRHATVVEAMGMRKDMENAWLKRHLVALGQGNRGADAQARIQSITRFVRFFQQSLSLGAGAVLVIYGEITPGAMIAASALMGRATHPVDTLMNTWKDVLATQKAFLALEAALEEHARIEPSNATTLYAGETPGVSIRLVDVYAWAAKRSTPILEGITLDIPAGALLGVTVPSGSGKSTLARVLLGIWPETKGVITFEDAPVQILEQPGINMRDAIGYLPQDVELFDGTIAENVARFGDVDPEKVIAACQQAGIHEMILRFSRGYDRAFCKTTLLA